MKTKGVLAVLTAKIGKENDLRDFIQNAVEIAKEEEDTVTWYAFQIDNATVGIFDTFENDLGREKHMNGKIPSALMARVEELLSKSPDIKMIDILSSK